MIWIVIIMVVIIIIVVVVGPVAAIVSTKTIFQLSLESFQWISAIVTISII